MKVLKIEENCGHFLDDQGGFSAIDKITKEDLFRIVNLVLTEDVELDEYKEDTIRNPAHQIIYKSISERISGLRERKQEFADESERLYLEEYERYRDKPAKDSA